MKSYARIVDGVVTETYAPPEGMKLVPGTGGLLTGLPGEWVVLTAAQAKKVSDHWLFDGTAFSAPPTLDAPTQPSKADILARIEALTALAQSLPDDAA